MLVDGYVPVTALIAPVHDSALRGITFAYTTWLGPNGPDGYRDNQGGVIWTGEPAAASRIPAASPSPAASASNSRATSSPTSAAPAPTWPTAPRTAR